MSTVIKTRLVKIGNSQGLRIPKVVLDQIQLSDDIEVEVQKDRLVIRSSARPRAGWDTLFREMVAGGDDQLLGPELQLTEWEKTEWEWQ